MEETNYSKFEIFNYSNSIGEQKMCNRDFENITPRNSARFSTCTVNFLSIIVQKCFACYMGRS